MVKEMVEYLEVGKIQNTHGVRGEVKVIPLTDDASRFSDLEWIYIDKNGVLEKYFIESVKYFKNLVILKFKGIDDMDAAMGLKGLFLKVDREHAVKLPEGSYFICDIIGCSVFEEDGVLLGEVKDVISTGSNDVYVVKSENGREILVPALKSVVKNVSVPEQRITVSLPEGLVDDEV